MFQIKICDRLHNKGAAVTKRFKIKTALHAILIISLGTAGISLPAR